MRVPFPSRDVVEARAGLDVVVQHAHEVWHNLEVVHEIAPNHEVVLFLRPALLPEPVNGGRVCLATDDITPPNILRSSYPVLHTKVLFVLSDVVLEILDSRREDV